MFVRACWTCVVNCIALVALSFSIEFMSTYFCSFADKKWEIWFHLEGRNPVKRGIFESDISLLTLQSLIASEGYGESDYMYYVKEEEIGSERVKYLGNEASVHEMLEFFHHVKLVNIKVMRNVQTGIST